MNQPSEELQALFASGRLEPMVVYDPATDATFDSPERSLEQNEEIIRQGLSTFVEVGRALLDIRNAGQFQDAGFTTFDDYCKGRWGFGKSWASEHIAGAKVVDALSVRDSELLPANLSQTRALSHVLNSDGEEAVRRAWAEIVESHQGDGAITAREIRLHLNPAGNVAPSQRTLSDRYLSALDRVARTVKSVKWAAEEGQGKRIPKPVAERYAEHAAAVRALAEMVESIANGETPTIEAAGEGPRSRQT